jgi:predicted permease
MSRILHDLRHALRAMRRAPLFYAGVVLTLALGIGANGAVFTILQAVLLEPLPYRRPGEVVMVWRAPEREPPSPTRNILAEPNRQRGALTGTMAFGWREPLQAALTGSAALLTWQGNLTAQFDLVLADRAERLRGALVTANFFDILGVAASRGRLFEATDEQANPSALVLSHGLWLRAFGGDPGVIGKPLTLIAGRAPRGPRTFTVVGVLPPAFRFTYPEETEAWAIEPWSDVERYGNAIGFRMIGRLQPGLTLSEAKTRVLPIRIGLDRPNQRPEDRMVVTLERVTDWVIGDVRPALQLLGGVALLLFLITCATVANALFVRMTERQRELAVRAALGADHRRLVAQAVTEGIVLSVAGALAGTLFAVLTLPVLRTLVPSSIPRADAIGVNAWLLAFAAGAAGLTTIVAALAPAWRSARFDLVSTLKRASGAVSADRATARWRQALVGLQAAVATALLILAALLLASFWRLAHVPLGFDAEHVLTVEMRLLDQKYMGRRPPPVPGQPPGAAIPSEVLRVFQEQLAARVRALPGVLDAGLTTAVPFRGVDFVFVLNRVGETRRYGANARFVDPGYFSVMRVAPMRGRLFTDTDTVASPRVAVLSEAYAREMFGSIDPIGQAVDLDGPVEVVGVVADLRYQSFASEPYPAIYFPRAQNPNELICVVARVAPNAGDLGPAVRSIVRDLDPAIPAMNLTTVDQIISDSVADRRFYTTATSAFAVVALLLTVVGLMVIVARSVVERRRELAIRSALGATPLRLIALVVRQGLAPVVAGAAVGVAGAFAGAVVVAQFLFHVAPREPLVYGSVALLVVGVASLASVVPARWIMAESPAAVLRAD